MTRSAPVRSGRPRRGFTLLELLVVMALVAAASGLLLAGLGADRATSLQAGQATLSNLVVAARSRAVARGQPVRLLFQHDAGGGPQRYLRVVVMEERHADEWRTVQSVALPSGIHFLPHRTRIPEGLLEDPAAWIQSDGSLLHSSALFRPPVRRQVDTASAELWAEVAFTPHGTTISSGRIVLTAGRTGPTPDGTPGRLILHEPDQVCGVQLSAYGMTTPISGRREF